jgi:hypothetical protein
MPGSSFKILKLLGDKIGKKTNVRITGPWLSGNLEVLRQPHACPLLEQQGKEVEECEEELCQGV